MRLPSTSCWNIWKSIHSFSPELRGNICVLFTANDAYMRDYRLVVPSDCVASNTQEDRDYSLRQMETILKSDIRQSTDIDLKALAKGRPDRSSETAVSRIKNVG
jgi:Isochorismatase family